MMSSATVMTKPQFETQSVDDAPSQDIAEIQSQAPNGIAGPTTEGIPRGRVPREIRERQVLALAEELFAERGYRGSSMEELARRAGVSKPVIYDVVGSKEQLHRRVFEHASAELEASVAEAAKAGTGEPGEQLRAGARAFFSFMESHGHVWSMLYDDDMGGVHAQHVRHVRDRQSNYVKQELAARAAANGRIVNELQLALVANTLNGAFESMATWWREQPQVSSDQLADWFVAMFAPGLKELLGG